MPYFGLKLLIQDSPHPIVSVPRGQTLVTSASALVISYDCMCGIPARKRQACIDSLSLIFSQPARCLAITLPSCALALLGPKMAGDSSRIVRVTLHKIIITIRNCHLLRPAIGHNPYAFAQILADQSTCLASLTINFVHGSSIEDAFWMSGAQVPLFPNLRMIRLYFGPEVPNYGVEMTRDFAEFARALIVASRNLLSFGLNGQLLRVDLARLFGDLVHPSFES